MSDSLKDDVVNNAIEFTRTFRPVVFSSKTGEPLIPVDHMTLSYQEYYIPIHCCYLVLRLYH